MFIRHNRDFTAGNRQAHLGADKRLVAVILRVHRDRHIGEHRFRTRGRDRNMPAAIGERVAEVPELAVDLTRFDLKVGNRGLQARVPIHQPLVAVDEALVEEIDEHLQDGAAEAFVHREAFIGPIHRTAEAAELARDLPTRFLFPFPHLGNEVFARKIGALLSGRVKLTLHHHLRRNARMVSANDPQGILALQTRMANEDVLQRVVERVADMEVARHIWRRINDRIGRRVGTVWAKSAAFFPMGVPFGFNCGRIEGFGQL